MEQVLEINTADLFCGGGGASTGCDKACDKLHFKRRGVAVNHWSIAVDTMRFNHPDLNVLDCKIEEAIPAELVHGKLHLLWASPSCFTAGHLVTTARGQIPIEDVKVGDMVLTHKLRWRRVIRKQHRFAPYTVVAKGAGHHGIVCTGSHKFWLRSSELEYIGDGRHAVRTYGDPQWIRIRKSPAE